MQKQILLIALMAFFIVPLSSQDLKIIPAPENLSIQKGNFVIPDRFTVDADEEFTPALNMFFNRVNQHGFSSEWKRSWFLCSPDLEIIKEPQIDNGNPEAYTLKITSKKIVLKAAGKSGVFYGLQTLSQVMLNQTSENTKNRTLPALTINDAPRYPWRGIMLDESRHFFGKKKVKEFLDWMAFYKLNKFHWHLTDVPGWRIEIKQYPKLTTIGATGNLSNPDASPKFYTQEDIREIIKYASDRFIEVIPEIDMPGHAKAANKAYPEFSGGGSEKYPEFTFNPGKEGTYAFLTDILREVGGLFPSEFIHLGGDEVHFGNHQWNNLTEVQSLMKKEKLENLQEVEHYFINRMADSLAILDKKLLGWDEIVNAHTPVEESVVMWWRHDKTDQLQKSLENGYKTILCPRIPLYFDFVQHESHESGRRWAGEYSTLKQILHFNEYFEKTITEYNHLIPGIQANLWTETIDTPERLDYMTFPRIAALAEAAWATTKIPDYQEFLDRLELSLQLYKKAGISFFNPIYPENTPEIKGPAK